MSPEDFPKIMADVKQFQAQLEHVFGMATNPKEKQLLGEAISNIKRGMAEAETAVPRAFAMIEEQARKVKAEGESLQQEFAQKRAEADQLIARQEQLDAQRRAKQPPLDELYGSLPPLDGADLRLDLFEGLQIKPLVATHGSRPLHIDTHRNIWEDWHWE